MKTIISKIERESDFQKKQAAEYKSGVHKDEIAFARYDHPD